MLAYTFVPVLYQFGEQNLQKYMARQAKDIKNKKISLLTHE